MISTKNLYYFLTLVPLSFLFFLVLFSPSLPLFLSPLFVFFCDRVLMYSRKDAHWAHYVNENDFSVLMLLPVLSTDYNYKHIPWFLVYVVWEFKEWASWMLVNYIPVHYLHYLFQSPSFPVSPVSLNSL